MSQINLATDVAHNVLRLSFAGPISGKMMVESETQFATAVEALRRGFSLLVDFTEMTSMSLDCVPSLERTMDAAAKHGVALVVRVIPDRSKDIGVGIISLFHYPRGLKIVTTDTREEAERALL